MNPVRPNESIPLIPSKQFTETRVLGTGAYGTVSLYNYTPPDAQIQPLLRAIKKLHSYDPNVFGKEVEPFRRLQHENLVYFYGLTSIGFNRGIVLEYMEGGNLHDVIHHLTPYNYSLKDILNWGIQSAKALEYMHNFDSTPHNNPGAYSRYIHRDIKPENMLLDRTWKNLKISDFGLAKEIDNSRNTRYRGTPLYMAPEVVQGKHYDETCDVYSWTLTFWECLTCSRPFEECINIEELKQKKTIENYLEYVNTGSKKLNVLIQSGSSIDRSKRISMCTWRMILEILIKNCEFLENEKQKEIDVCLWNEQTTDKVFHCKGLENFDWINFNPKSMEDSLKILINKE